MRFVECSLCKVLQSYSVQSAKIIGISLQVDKQLASYVFNVPCYQLLIE